MMQIRVLIIGPAWVGDMVMAQTLFKALKKKHGNNLILDVFANEWASGLVSRMEEVNSVIRNPFPHGKLNILKRVKSGIGLRKNKYEEVYVLPNSLKSAITPFFAKIKRRVGFVGESRYGLLNEAYKLDKKKLPLMIDRFCALANNGVLPDSIEWPKLNIDKKNQSNLLHKFKINNSIPIVAFCPAAEFGPAKRWPPEHFAKLASTLTKSGFQIVILGSQKDTEISKTIITSMHGSGQVFDLCGKTSLTDTVDILAASKFVVTNDSGLMHIACAVDTEVIAIYGSTSPDFTPPLSKKAKIMQIKLDCSPCFQRTCRFGHYNCLNNITPNMVISQLNHLGFI